LKKIQNLKERKSLPSFPKPIPTYPSCSARTRKLVFFKKMLKLGE